MAGETVFRYPSSDRIYQCTGQEPSIIVAQGYMLPALQVAGARQSEQISENGLYRCDPKALSRGWHEMLNETNKDKVWADTLAWLEGKL